jgi:hypothetical protein
MRCMSRFLICLIDYICRSMSDTFIYFHLYTCTKFSMKFKTRGGVCNISFY